jgi:hypothetical protein
VRINIVERETLDAERKRSARDVKTNRRVICGLLHRISTRQTLRGRGILQKEHLSFECPKDYELAKQAVETTLAQDPVPSSSWNKGGSNEIFPSLKYHTTIMVRGTGG